MKRHWERVHSKSPSRWSDLFFFWNTYAYIYFFQILFPCRLPTDLPSGVFLKDLNSGNPHRDQHCQKHSLHTHFPQSHTLPVPHLEWQSWLHFSRKFLPEEDPCLQLQQIPTTRPRSPKSFSRPNLMEWVPFSLCLRESRKKTEPTRSCQGPAETNAEQPPREI